MSKQITLEMVNDYAYELGLTPKSEPVPGPMLEILKRQMEASLAVVARHQAAAGLQETAAPDRKHVAAVQDAFNSAINFAVDEAGPEGLTFLRLWREGDFQAIAHEFPEFDTAQAA